jgi:hypothetical protein
MPNLQQAANIRCVTLHDLYNMDCSKGSGIATTAFTEFNWIYYFIAAARQNLDQELVMLSESSIGH